MLIVDIDLTTRRLFRLLKRRGPKTLRGALQKSDGVLNKSLEEMTLPCFLEKDDAVNYLNEYMRRIESELASILERHGAYKFLLLHRRLPANYLKEELSHKGSLRVIERITTLAILKYSERSLAGTRQVFDGRSKKTETVIDINARDLEDLLSVSLLSKDYYLCSTTRRTVWKGASLALERGRFPEVVIDNRLARLVRFYDDRLDNNRSLFDVVGLLHDNSELERDTGDLFILGATEAEETTKPLQILWGSEKVLLPPPNFHPGILETRRFKIYLRLFESAIRDTYGVKPELVASLLDRLTLWMLQRFKEEAPMRLYQYSQRALAISSLSVFEEFCGTSIRVRNRSFGPIAPSEFFRLFGLEVDENVDLETTHPFKSVYTFRDDDRIIVDLLSNPGMLGGFILNAQLSDIEKNIKSETFEDEVWSYLSDVRDVLQPFPVRKIFRKDGRDMTQVDVSVGKDGVLFLIECKAYSQNRKLSLGETHAVRNRWKTVLDWIEESKSKAKRIASHPIGDNYAVPDTFSHTIPLVTAPFPEFFFELTEDLMLDDKIPIVCTPSELKRYLTSFSKGQAISKSFVQPIHGGSARRAENDI
jgi:hypothetical protein